jgi:predicted kinase
LYFLEVADMSGRYCPDKEKQLEYLTLFKMFCQDYGLWGPESQPYVQWKNHLAEELVEFDADTQDLIYANAIRDRESGSITTPEEAVAKSYGYRDVYAQVVLMCGPSGAGKTSWIAEHLPDYHLVSLDDIREDLTGDRTNQKMQGQVMQEAKARFKHHLRSHHRVIWDATNLRSDFRAQVCDLAYAYQALVTLVVFQQPEASFFEGNRDRDYSVPEDVLQRQIETMEWPLPDEVHRYVVVGEEHQVLRFHGGLQDRLIPF